MLKLIDELTYRWLLKDCTDREVFDKLDRWEVTFYFGMDPTADSLHLWNFVNFMTAIHLMKRWNICIPLVWWATGMIGDPGGKDAERVFLDADTLQHNFDAICTQVAWLFDTLQDQIWILPHQPIINNKTFYDWLWYLDFLKIVWKYITVNSMMTKETVKKRLQDPDKSISYTEFSYMLIQWYDFVQLYKNHGCTLQIAWSDQWWNITSGTEMIRKLCDRTAYGLTCPLIVDANGKKFGKSAWNAIWLDPKKSSAYVLYQYFINTDDLDVERYLKLFTLYDQSEIEDIMQKHIISPHLREWQIALANSITRLIHWDESMTQAIIATVFSFSLDPVNEFKNLDDHSIQNLISRLWSIPSGDICDMLISCWYCWSKTDAKKLIQQWAIRINWEIIKDITHNVQPLVHTYGMIQKWKKSLKIIQF